MTFGLRSAAASLSNFPKFQQAGDIKLGNGTATIAQKGALLTAVASILRYHQNRGELGSSQWFRRSGGAQSVPDRLLSHRCPRAPRPATASLPSPIPASRWSISGVRPNSPAAPMWKWPRRLRRRSRISWRKARRCCSRSRCPLNGAPAGGHFVVATGIEADGSIVIQDPSPLFARTQPGRLPERLQCCRRRLEGECARRRALRAAQSRLHPLPGGGAFAARRAAADRSPRTSRPRPESAGSRSNSSIRWTRRATPAGTGSAALPSYCLRWRAAGLSDSDRRRATIPRAAHRPGARRVADRSFGQRCRPPIGPPGRNSISRWRRRTSASRRTRSSTGPRSHRESRPAVWCRSSVLDFPVPGKATTVDMDGVADARCCSRRRFRSMRRYRLRWHQACIILRVQSAYGSSQQAVTVSAVAPGIFLIGNPPIGAITNQNFNLVGPSNPLPRGQALVIFATGLGAVTQSGQLSRTNAPVTVLLNGTELPASFAGLAPGFIGLYQVNVTDPGRYAAGARDSPYAQSWWTAKQFGVGSVTVMQEKMGPFGVKLLTRGPQRD